MAQLRQDFDKFNDEETVILVVGPEDKTRLSLIGWKTICHLLAFQIQNTRY